MKQHPAFGLLLALAGALIISPDTLLMRLSGMGGFEMLGWRGTAMGLVLIAAWVLTARGRHVFEAGALVSGAGLALILCQAANGALFSVAIAVAPVTVVLMGVATVPVFSALLSQILLGEPTTRATWITIAAVLFGIGLAIFGKSDAGLPFDMATFWGGLMGLSMGLLLAMTFVLIRKHHQLPILLGMGLGALISGMVGLSFAQDSGASTPQIMLILTTGAFILPASFFLLTLANRYTASANVSLLMLLETVLGPILVWVGVGEAPTPLMMVGGAIVVASLATYLVHMRLARGRAARVA
ncbi:DMT family transporter [Rhodobacteraceae bacterium XHP0102]|nr:DMT family transporter [Rhodobacteraceae bacterium XHP0102]